MKKITIREIAYVAMGAAFVAVCSWIRIPLMIPVTLQTFAVCLITAVFGLKLGMWTVVTYILLGLVGIPVFSGFNAGIGYLLGNTGGYILGFVFTALIVGLVSDRFPGHVPALVLSMVVGILVCYAFGTAWFMIGYARKTGPIGLMTALGWCVFPYLLPDAAKIVLATVLAGRLRPLFRKEREKCL